MQIQVCISVVVVPSSHCPPIDKNFNLFSHDASVIEAAQKPKTHGSEHSAQTGPRKRGKKIEIRVRFELALIDELDVIVEGLPHVAYTL